MVQHCTDVAADPSEDGKKSRDDASEAGYNGCHPSCETSSSCVTCS